VGTPGVAGFTGAPGEFTIPPPPGFVAPGAETPAGAAAPPVPPPPGGALLPANADPQAAIIKAETVTKVRWVIMGSSSISK
jgi:hypothetical protein